MNTVELSDRVKQQYIDYLKTTFYLRDPQLRESLAKELTRWDLVKGPYLQATSTFRTGRKLGEIYRSITGNVLDEKVEAALTAGRPLYAHQDKAVSKVLSGRNIVVSTGTGSGKTESFLLPILLNLFSQHGQKQLGPGVRALVLYPMNALANDQRDRLVGRPTQPGDRGGISYELNKVGADFSFTVGQYIGETPENERDKYRLKNSVQPGVGELLYREEMRNTPPNVLLTNFSMLEYLLLRPNDSPLFDGKNAETWTYLVLDEAHQYRGAMGIEMAMLIRRLKQRLKEEGCSTKLRCIATSASLVNGDEDIPAVAQFASDLFDEHFDPSDVILGETVIESFTKTIQLKKEDLERLTLAISTTEEPDEIKAKDAVSDIANKNGILLPNLDWKKNLGTLLLQDKSMAQLKEVISACPTKVEDLARLLFPSESSEVAKQTLSHLVDLSLAATNPETGTAMLSARYHLFLRSLEGAFLLLKEEPKISLERKAAGGSETGFELALCRECGQHYIVGKIESGKFTEARRDPSDEEFGAEFFIVREMTDDTELKEKDYWKLCTECGDIVKAAKQLNCKHGSFVLLEQPPSAKEHEDQIPECIECNHKGRDPVRELIQGADGPHSVIAATLYKNLPKGRNKVLAFADGRQDAAFFAWYLEQTYKELLYRALVVHSLKTNRDLATSFSLSEIAPLLVSTLRENKLLPKSSGELDYKREANIILYRELLTEKQRISPEGVGLISWTVNIPEEFTVPSLLLEAPWNLTQETARSFVSVLLDTLRAHKAIELDTKTCPGLQWNQLAMQASNQSICFGPPNGKKNVTSWNGKTGRRAKLISKYCRSLDKLPDNKAIDDLLASIWEAVTDHDRQADFAEDKILIKSGDTYRLNPRHYKLRLIGADDEVLACGTCQRISHQSLGTICPRGNCPGKIKPLKLTELQTNHYRDSYEQEIVGNLRVEEHTAQLNSDKAREFQQEFKEGKINVLSCSTTFELGVDLGDLDTIFLRNVPPESFNYDQRVGRAGRRRGRAGFAVTFCKRGPHDLYHFSDPLTMLQGKVKPPILAIKNPKIILRHLTAYALSCFFRIEINRTRFQTTESLFIDFSSPSFSRDFRDFLRVRKNYFEDVFSQLISENAELKTKLGLDDGAWIELMAGSDSKLEIAQSEICSDFISVETFQNEASSKQDFKSADWAKRRLNSIRGLNVLNFLSQKTVIPKYGFPVDVVELDTSSDSSSVGLDRDLSIAISEFAPGSQLIANKKLWTSYGLKKVRDKELETKNYFRCDDHNIFLQWSTTNPAPETRPCDCKGRTGTYVVPAHGFTTTKAPPEEPKGRVVKLFTNRPYFAYPKDQDNQEIVVPDPQPCIKLTKTRPGIMVVICEGKKRQSFRICEKCGYGTYAIPKKAGEPHRDSFGRACTGMLKVYALGHQFETDIIQLKFEQKTTAPNKVWFAYALASAIVESAAEVLEVPASDISATVGPATEDNIPTIIVYDDVPGGAGLVAKLEAPAILMEVLKTAKKRVSGICNCSEDTSCYGCLRSYRNQFMHEHLVRGHVHEYLKSLETLLQLSVATQH